MIFFSKFPIILWNIVLALSFYLFFSLVLSFFLLARALFSWYFFPIRPYLFPPPPGGRYFPIYRPLNGLLAILKNILELEQWTNRKQEFTQRTDRKTRTAKNSIGLWYSCPICFYLNRVGKSNDDISSEEHFENPKTRRGTDLLL